MILLTVGTQLPFDRLVRAMDAIAPHLPDTVFAQIGDGAYIPKNFEYSRMVRPDELADRFRNSTRVVSHAGTGSLLTARRFGKPIILFPRRASLGEHRNEHQLATCRQLEGEMGLSVAYDEGELRALLNKNATPEEAQQQASSAGSMLGSNIADYIRKFDEKQTDRH